jgi:pimeloyl-ACP methyl ester carboxylesterase
VSSAAAPTEARPAAVLATEGADLAQARDRWVPLDSARVHYVTLGRGGTPVVLVHGWAGAMDVWRDVAADLARDTRVVLLDLPGHGRSDAPRTAYTMELFARAVDAVLRDAGIRRAVLVGHSMGTPVICRVLRDHPGRVAALASVDGALRGFDLTPEQREAFIAPYRGEHWREAATRFIGAMFPNPGTEALRDRVLATTLGTPRHVMVSAFEGMFDRTSWELDTIPVPLLVANAPNPSWNEAYRASVAKLAPRLDYRTIEGAGHFVMVEKPVELAAALRSFLEANGFRTP